MSFFPEVEGIRYEGPDSKNPLSFRHYNPEENVEGKAMRDHFRFAVCYGTRAAGRGAIRSGRGVRGGPGRTCVVPDRGVSGQTMDAALAKLNELLERNRASRAPKKKPWWKFW